MKVEDYCVHKFPIDATSCYAVIRMRLTNGVVPAYLELNSEGEIEYYEFVTPVDIFEHFCEQLEAYGKPMAEVYLNNKDFQTLCDVSSLWNVFRYEANKYVDSTRQMLERLYQATT